jgi:hypothetical protein
VRAESTNRVSFIDVEVELEGKHQHEEGREVKEQTHLVHLLELQDPRQVNQSSFHRIETLDNEENLLPRAMRPRLTLGDRLPEQALQVLHVVVRVLADHRSRETRSEPN